MHSMTTFHGPAAVPLTAVGLLLTLLLLPEVSQAQSLDSVAVPTRTFAIENARIVYSKNDVIFIHYKRRCLSPE